MSLSNPCIGGSSGAPTFINAEVPGGLINGANSAFTLAQAPSPATSLQLFYNGALLTAGVDYTLAGAAITMLFVPQVGDALIAFYRTSSTGVNFIDAEAPVGLINSVNAVYTLTQSPSPGASLMLYLNGILQTGGGVDFTLAGNQITYNVAPTTGDNHVAFYRY